MLRSTTKALAVLVLALAPSGCGSDPARIALTITDSMSPPLSGLARLRIIVRKCDGQIAIAQNLSTAPSSNAQIEASLAPGDRFYIWVQGWERCSPTPPAQCVPEESAMLGKDCECVPSETPNMQQLTEDSCTAVMPAVSGRTSITAMLGQPGSCPPLLSQQCGM